MIPVLQDRFFGDPRGGNCLAACIASLLNVPLSEVPQRTTTDASFQDWERLALWLHERGLTLMEIDGRPWSTNGLLDADHEAPLCIGNGPSPRGAKHSVVMRGDELVHDPHPEGGGIAAVESRYFLVPLDPAPPEVPRD